MRLTLRKTLEAEAVATRWRPVRKTGRGFRETRFPKARNFSYLRWLRGLATSVVCPSTMRFFESLWGT